MEILVVDDHQPTAKFFADLLRRHDFVPTEAHSAEQAIQLMRGKHFPLVLSDVHLRGSDGLTLLPFAKAQNPEPVVIFMTGLGAVDTAVKALSDGAFEYLCKEDDLNEMEDELVAILKRAIAQLRQPQDSAPPAEPTPPSAKGLVGTSSPMVALYRLIARAAVSRGNVLISGESGTGKELVAHAIHQYGPWANKPFVMVNCGALTETLLESELFGHVKGAFTGASNQKRGLFEEADGGMLFLDEIGDVSQHLQVKLLRAIQEGEIKPVGSVETRKVKVRVVAATHRDLEKRIREEQFREDLFYRLKVFHLRVPSLQERREDIPALAVHFLARAAEKSEGPAKQFSKEALEELKNYPWPGNVRELENAIERAYGIACGTMLTPRDFELDKHPPVLAPLRQPDLAAVASGNQDQAVPPTLEQVECLHIAKVLELVYYNKSKAAKILGIDRGTLYNKAEVCGIPLRGTL